MKSDKFAEQCNNIQQSFVAEDACRVTLRNALRVRLGEIQSALIRQR